MTTVKIEFTSRSFVIEEATLVLYNIPAAGLASITGIDMPPGASVTDTVLRELAGLFPSQTVRDGSTEVAPMSFDALLVGLPRGFIQQRKFHLWHQPTSDFRHKSDTG
jgi:hypothetical protein